MSTWEAPRPVPDVQEAPKLAAYSPFRFSPSPAEVKTRRFYCTMHRVLMEGGHSNDTAGFKKMTKLSNNGKYI